MPQQTSPFTETKWGWNYGEAGWNSGMDENLLKMGFMFDGNVDAIVASLPAAVNGNAYFLTTDNRFYFVVGGIYYSSPCPKHFIFKIKATGDFYQFDGTSAVQVDNPSQVGGRLDSVEATIASLGTAAFEDVADLATQAELDVASAQANDYTDTLRSDLANATDPAKGAGMVGFLQAGAGAVGRTLLAKAREVVSVKDFGAVGDGSTNDTAALLAFFTYCIDSGVRGRITAGDYLITPGQLDFSSGWEDKAWPMIETDGHDAVRFIAASDVDAPILRINNGTAATASYKLWRGGLIGGITFVDPFTASSATTRHGLSIYGMSNTQFGHMRGEGLHGDVLHFERKLFQPGNNPDPYNVYSCSFVGVEAIGCWGYAVNHDNFVGITHCEFKFIRAVDAKNGGIRGLGTCCKYSYISMGNVIGWAFDLFKDLLNGTRNVIELAELDNVEKAFNMPYSTFLEIKDVRIVHRYQFGPNTSPVYWPTVCFDFLNDAQPIAVKVAINSQHRINAGGTLAAIGIFNNFRNSPNARDVKVNMTISDDAALGIPSSGLVTSLAASALAVEVWSRGEKVASTAIVPGCAVTATTSEQVSNTGYTTATAKINFPTEVYDRGGYYDPATGYFTVPFSGIYRARGAITLAVASGTRIRLGFGYDRGGAVALAASRVHYADTSSARSYDVDAVISLNAGDKFFIMADQNTGAPVSLASVNGAAVENQWSIEAVQ